MRQEPDKVIVECCSCRQLLNIPANRRKLQLTCPKCRARGRTPNGRRRRHVEYCQSADRSERPFRFARDCHHRYQQPATIGLDRHSCQRWIDHTDCRFPI